MERSVVLSQSEASCLAELLPKDSATGEVDVSPCVGDKLGFQRLPWRRIRGDTPLHIDKIKGGSKIVYLDPADSTLIVGETVFKPKVGEMVFIPENVFHASKSKGTKAMLGPFDLDGNPQNPQNLTTGGKNPIRSAKGSRGDSTYVGCFIDKHPDRDLTVFSGLGSKYKQQTKESCSKTCKDKGYSYFGLQYPQQGTDTAECGCGNTYGKHDKADESECNMNGQYRLGGEWRNAIYTTDDFTPPKCWEVSKTIDQLDAVCPPNMVCARKGFNERNFGGCMTIDGKFVYATEGETPDHHCCSPVPTKDNDSTALGDEGGMPLEWQVLGREAELMHVLQRNKTLWAFTITFSILLVILLAAAALAFIYRRRIFT